jgi:hypothetical protein
MGQLISVHPAFERGQVILYAERFMQGVLLTGSGTEGAGTAMSQRIICAAENAA